MEAPAARLVSDERSSAWAEELQRLAVEVSALPPAAQRALRTVLDAIACEDACEVKHAEQLRKQIAAFDPLHRPIRGWQGLALNPAPRHERPDRPAPARGAKCRVVGKILATFGKPR